MKGFVMVKADILLQNCFKAGVSNSNTQFVKVQKIYIYIYLSQGSGYFVSIKNMEMTLLDEFNPKSNNSCKTFNNINYQ